MLSIVFTRCLIVRIVLIAACLTGCGGGGGGGGGGGNGQNGREPLDRLPSGARFVAAVDVAGAREALGLPVDADLVLGGSADEKRLFLAAAYALPHLQQPVKLPILEVLDHKRIEAAASGGQAQNQQVTAVRTSQPPSEVLEGLEDQGYRRDGDLVVSDEAPSTVVYGAAAESDGLLFLASDEEGLRQALAGKDEQAGAAERLLRDELEGPVRLASARPDADCLRAIGAQEAVDPAAGEFALGPAGEPDPQRVRLGAGPETAAPFLREIRFEEAQADGRLLRVPYSYEAGRTRPSPAGLLMGDLPVSAFYDCG